jgi:hypothetical protein
MVMKQVEYHRSNHAFARVFCFSWLLAQRSGAEKMSWSIDDGLARMENFFRHLLL